jgi:hypothetical protein
MVRQHHKKAGDVYPSSGIFADYKVNVQLDFMVVGLETHLHHSATYSLEPQTLTVQSDQFINIFHLARLRSIFRHSCSPDHATPQRITIPNSIAKLSELS